MIIIQTEKKDFDKIALMVTFSRKEVEVSDPDRARPVCPGGGKASTQTHAGDHFSSHRE